MIESFITAVERAYFTLDITREEADTAIAKYVLEERRKALPLYSPSTRIEERKHEHGRSRKRLSARAAKSSTR